MFDKFLKVAHTAQKTPHQDACTPEQNLFDILSGGTKLAFSCMNDDHKWIEQFAGTPLQDQAMALEQQDIQNEIAEKQYNMGNDGKQRSFWQNRDQIQLQKRMLELQLFQSKTNPTAAIAGPVGPAGPEADAMTGGSGGGSPATPETGVMETGAKVAAIKEAIGDRLLAAGVARARQLAGSPEASRLIGRMDTLKSLAAKKDLPHVSLAADALGLAARAPLRAPVAPVQAIRSPIRSSIPSLAKAASIDEEKLLWADQAGRMLAKQAFDMGQLKGLGTSALNYAKANPTKALAAAGGVGGAAYGAATAQGQNGQGPTIGQRLGRAAGFGAAGAGAGAAVGGGIHGARAVGDRMKATGETARQSIGGVLGEGVGKAHQSATDFLRSDPVQSRIGSGAARAAEGLSPYVQAVQGQISRAAYGV